MLARDTYFGGPNAYKTVITSKDKEEAFVKKRVKEFHKHPALLGWCTLKPTVSLATQQIHLSIAIIRSICRG